MILNFELFKAVQRVFAMDESSPLKWTEIITFLWENLIFFSIFSNKMDRIHVPFKEKEKKNRMKHNQQQDGKRNNKKKRRKTAILLHHKKIYHQERRKIKSYKY